MVLERQSRTGISSGCEQELLFRVSRIAAFDLARGLAAFFMVTVHVLDTYSLPSVQASGFGYVIEFLGSPPSAPVFMFLMGTSMAFSARARVTQELRRGFRLFALGYLLNVLRGVSPLWLALQLGTVTLEEAAPYTPLSELLVVDILQFAGIALGLCALLKRFWPDPRCWVGVAALIALVSPLLWGSYSGWAALDHALRLLWGSDAGVAFPLFPWLAYPLAGMAFGSWLKSTDNHAKVFRHALLAGLVLLFVGTGVSLTNLDFHVGDYSRSGPGAVMWIMGFVLVWLWLCRSITDVAKNIRVFDRLFFWSATVTRFYFVQWVIIGWGVMAIGPEESGLGSTVLAMIGVVVLTDLVTSAWNWLAARGSAYPSDAFSTRSKHRLR
jgi:uncharacterized membrane protein